MSARLGRPLHRARIQAVAQLKLSSRSHLDQYVPARPPRLARCFDAPRTGGVALARVLFALQRSDQLRPLRTCPLERVLQLGIADPQLFGIVAYEMRTSTVPFRQVSSRSSREQLYITV